MCYLSFATIFRATHGQYEAATTSYRSIPGYGNNIRLDRGDSLVVHPSENGRVVTLEYEVHGKVVATDTPYDNRFVSIATIESRKIVRWRDYMDSLAAWTALNKSA
jgi:ketosteroid isomerase-like protein